MPKFEATLYGHRSQYHSYKATVEIEANSEEDAKQKAQIMADDGEVEWEEEFSYYSTTSTVEVDNVGLNEFTDDDDV